MNKKILGVIGILVVIAAVWYVGWGKTEASVATVNGVAITQKAYDAQLATVTANLKAQGIATDTAEAQAEIKTQVLNDLISNELVMQGIKASGVTATDAEVETEFQALVTQNGGEAGFQAALKQANVSEKDLRANIKNQIAIQKYLLANVNVDAVAVTDAEISTFYDEYKTAQGTTTPALSEISADIKQQLTLNKQQELVNAFIADLRAKAAVETSI